MKLKIFASSKLNTDQRGAALVTVIMISVLLLTASIALLSAVSANSRNSTDVLSETKAYYAAESGLQATINVLRNDSTVDYQYADDNPTLSAKLPYNWPIGAPTRAVIGEAPGTYTPNSGSAYSITVTDPDNSSDSLTFYTSGTFTLYTGGTISTNGKTVYFPNQTASSRTEITFADAASTTHNFSGNPSLGTFSMLNVGGGVQITSEVKFRIDYHLTAPRSAVKTIWGSIKQASSSAPKIVTFQSQAYSLLGSTMELCSATTGGPNCADVSFTLGSTPSILYAYITALKPYRLKVVSTGYGPNGSRKQLEAVIQKSLFNGLASGAATTMIGTNATPPGGLPFFFSPGTSTGVTYSGGNCATTGCVPSFGLTDPANLAYVTAHPPSGDPTHMQPPPALLGDAIPEWQQSPASLDVLIDQLRVTAQNSGRYFVQPGGNLTNPGSFATGTGITFCEGSCQVGGSGGGILVVTGMLTNLGGFDFKGMIIVTGEEGWQRNGGGNGQVIGNVIIAPYNKRSYVPENLSSTFLAPRYYITGGGSSDIIYDDISATFDNTAAISDFMLGIAEK